MTAALFEVGPPARSRKDLEAPVVAAGRLELTPLERDILDFEGSFHFTYSGSYEDAITTLFDRRVVWSPTRYTQLLNALLDREAALAHAPGLVNRLRRIRDGRLDTRARMRELGAPHRPVVSS